MLTAQKLLDTFAICIIPRVSTDCELVVRQAIMVFFVAWLVFPPLGEVPISTPCPKPVPFNFSVTASNPEDGDVSALHLLHNIVIDGAGGD